MKRESRTLPWEQVYAREVLARLRKTSTDEMKDIYSFPDRLWDKLRYNGERVKDLAVGHLPHDSRAARRAREWQWEIFKATRPNWVPWFIYITDRQYTGLFERTRQRRPTGSQLFDDLSPDIRAEAENLLNQFCERWNRRTRFGGKPPAELPGWKKPLLVGVARRLARDQFNRSPEWGRQMLRIKGGKHTQRRYREQGWHPLASVRKAWGLSQDRPPL